MAEETKTTKNKKTNMILIGGLAVVIVLLVVIIVRLMANQAPEPVERGETSEEPEKRNVLVTEDTAEDIADDMANREYVEPGYYITSMATEWHFAKGDAASEDAYVENKAGNTNDVFFDVFLADDEEEPIYQSPVLPRGSKINDITLDTPLPAGTHDCVMVYHLVDEDQNTVSTLRIAFKIIVEK